MIEILVLEVEKNMEVRVLNLTHLIEFGPSWFT